MNKITLLNKPAQIKIQECVVAKFSKIKVKPGVATINYKCQLNAVHHAIENRDSKIAITIYFDKAYPIIHFVNYHNGQYIDNTWGHWSSQHEYFFIKFIDKEDFFAIDSIFELIRKEVRSWLPLWLRLLSNYNA